MNMKFLNLARILLERDAELDCTCDTRGCEDTCSVCSNSGCTGNCPDSTTTTVPERDAGSENLIMKRHLSRLEGRLSALEAIFESGAGRKLRDELTESAIEGAIEELSTELSARRKLE